MFPLHPNLATRSTTDGAGNLYSECHRRGELLGSGDMVSDIKELLSEALGRWGYASGHSSGPIQESRANPTPQCTGLPAGGLGFKGPGVS